MRNIVLIFMFALTVRLGYIAALKPNAYAGDSYSWEKPALNMLAGENYGEARRPPLYPLLLTAVYFLFGHSIMALQIIQSVIGSLTCAAVYLIGRTLFSQLPGIIAAVLAGFYPYSVFYTGMILSETLYAFMITATILAVIRTIDSFNYWNWLITGVFLALTSLCKPVFLIFIPFYIVWFIFSEKGSSYSIKAGAIALLGMAMTVLPWTFRNYSYYGGFLLISTGAHDFWMTNNDMAMQLETLPEMDESAPEKWNWFPKEKHEEIAKLPALDAEKVFLKDGLAWVGNNTNKFAWLLWRRFLHFWRLWPTMAARRDKLIAKFTSGIYLPLAWIGMALSIKNIRKKSAILIVLFVSITMGHLLFATMIRYRVPIDPLVLVFTGYTISLLYEKLRKYADKWLLKQA
jgi:4-amino-4-deoxy-L-arabinose transferase-like glycosyltransferase